MRKPWINVLASAVLLLAAAAVGAQPKPDPPKPEPPAKDKEAPPKSKLEQMLELALKNNPDLRVAEAKAREADAEVARTRLAVTQKVVQLYNNIEVARAQVQLAEKQFARMRELGAQKAVDQALLDEAEAKLRQAKAELAKLEAEVPYVLGQPNAKVRGDGKDWELFLGKVEPGDENRAAAESALRYLGRLHGPDDTSSTLALMAWMKATAPAVSPSMTEKIAAALDKPTTVDFGGKKALWLDEVLAMIQKQHPDLLLNYKGSPAPGGTAVAAVKFDAVPLRTVLQWLEDELPEDRFVVRDYGLLIVGRDKLPPGALLLQELKAKDKETTKPKEEKK